jgi:hypothetical protein
MPWDSQMIWNCPATDPNSLLEYRCPELWWSLEQTADPNVRFCTNCRKSVHLCETPDEFVRHGEQGHTGMSLGGRLVGYPSAESVAELATRKAALADWWAEVIARLPSALGGSSEPMREQVARVRSEAEPPAAPDPAI